MSDTPGEQTYSKAVSAASQIGAYWAVVIAAELSTLTEKCRDFEMTDEYVMISTYFGDKMLNNLDTHFFL